MPDLELARTVLRQGELRLQEQRSLAVAMDQRASALAGIFATGAAAGFGFAVQAGMDPAARIGIGMAALGLTVAALCAMRAAWPGTLWLAGADPANWWSDGVEDRPLYDCLKRESWDHAVLWRKRHRRSVMTAAFTKLRVYTAPVAARGGERRGAKLWPKVGGPESPRAQITSGFGGPSSVQVGC